MQSRVVAGGPVACEIGKAAALRPFEPSRFCTQREEHSVRKEGATRQMQPVASRVRVSMRSWRGGRQWCYSRPRLRGGEG